jgi:DNA-binding transcriptional LysR family regulator
LLTVDLRHLEHFLAVAEERSFTRAAKRVHLVQSALSASIRVLERDLGAPLFERSTHQVRLSEAGEALLPEARRVLLAVGAARDAVAATSNLVRGVVRLGVMQSLALTNAAELFSSSTAATPR